MEEKGEKMKNYEVKIEREGDKAIVMFSPSGVLDPAQYPEIVEEILDLLRKEGVEKDTPIAWNGRSPLPLVARFYHRATQEGFRYGGVFNPRSGEYE